MAFKHQQITKFIITFLDNKYCEQSLRPQNTYQDAIVSTRIARSSPRPKKTISALRGCVVRPCFPFSTLLRMSRKTGHHDASNRPQNMNIMAALQDTSFFSSKRRRVTRACDNCKSRKRRCDGEKPCAYCTEHRALCTYDAPYTRGRPDLQSAASSETSPKRVPRWRPHGDENSVTLSTNLSAESLVTSSFSRTIPRWPQVPLDQAQTSIMDSDDRGGAQSSRARSPIGGEGTGQYLGPASLFSVSHY